MSRADRTPAPARRFLHPSSSATPAATSARKPVPPFSQSRVSGVAASSYGRASQFSARSSSQRDDITTSFEDDEASQSLPNIAVRRANDDDIVCEEDHLPQLPAAAHDDVLDKKDFGDSPSNEPALWNDADIETPMPKRRKLSGPRAAAPEPINISSSPSDDMPQSPTMSEDVADGLSPTKLTTPQTTTRFRAPLSMSLAGDSRPSKPTFRAVDSRSNNPEIFGSVLPEAFTPSRRRGKHDYVQGGLADTVRSWVLQISTDESQRGNKEESEVQLIDAVMDRSRRAISAFDLTGRQWLLAGSQSWSNSSVCKSTVQRMNDGLEVTIRGTSTSWTVPLSSLGHGPDIQVAGQWDLPTPSEL